MTQAAPHPATGPGPNELSQPPGRNARRRMLPALFVLTAFALAAGAGLLWWQRLHARADTSTLEPAPATASILVPAEHETASAPPAVTPVAAAASVPPAIETTEERLASLRGTVDQLIARVAALEETDRPRGEQLSAFRADLERMTAEREKAAERRKQDMHALTATGRRTARAAVGTRGAPSLPAVASILAVDLWGGQPSVVVRKEGTDGAEVRFINQGETQGRVTLKRADVGSQRATFATPAGEFTMSAGDR